MFPGIFSLANRYLNLTDRIGSLLLALPNVTNTIVTIILSRFVRSEPSVLFLLEAGCFAFIVVLLITLWLLVR